MDSATPPKSQEEKRQLGLFDVAAVVVGGIIGVGIFFTPGSVAREMPSPIWVLGIWVLCLFLSPFISLSDSPPPYLIFCVLYIIMAKVIDVVCCVSVRDSKFHLRFI